MNRDTERGALLTSLIFCTVRAPSPFSSSRWASNSLSSLPSSFLVRSSSTHVLCALQISSHFFGFSPNLGPWDQKAFRNQMACCL